MADSLLSEIEAFLDARGMSPSRFGTEALRDKHFVEELRKGRRCWPETQARVRLFMATFEAKPRRKAA